VQCFVCQKTNEDRNLFILSAGILKNPNLLEKIETGDEDLGVPL
jgi:hypothetical protein